MTILASKEFACIHPAVSKVKNKNEGCKELMDVSYGDLNTGQPRNHVNKEKGDKFVLYPAT